MLPLLVFGELAPVLQGPAFFIARPLSRHSARSSHSTRASLLNQFYPHLFWLAPALSRPHPRERYKNLAFSSWVKRPLTSFMATADRSELDPYEIIHTSSNTSDKRNVPSPQGISLVPTKLSGRRQVLNLVGEQVP